MASSRRAPAPHLVPVDDEEPWYGESEPTVQIGQRIAAVRPGSFAETRLAGEYFRAGYPVILNLSDLEYAEVKRAVDFACGLVFSLHGAIERVTSRVFLLSPAGFEIVDGAGNPSQDPSFFNQA